MKPHRDASELANRLGTAASKPVPLPESPKDEAPKQMEQRTVIRSSKDPVDTVAISLRPDRALWLRYVQAAGERTTKSGRVVSAQEIMLEVLEQGQP